MSDDFPAPLRPSSAKISPSPTANSTHAAMAGLARRRGAPSRRAAAPGDQAPGGGGSGGSELAAGAASPGSRRLYGPVHAITMRRFFCQAW